MKFHNSAGNTYSLKFKELMFNNTKHHKFQVVTLDRMKLYNLIAKGKFRVQHNRQLVIGSWSFKYTASSIT